jgi:hypothetical protein
MKYLILFLLSFNLFATEVDGTITYKLPNGELVDRVVSIDVPSRGQGEVILRSGDFEWRTTKFWSKEKHGKMIFAALFDTKFRDTESKLLFKGTYLKGSNKLIYAGDIYKKKDGEKKHIGLFNFEYLR